MYKYPSLSSLFIQLLFPDLVRLAFRSFQAPCSSSCRITPNSLQLFWYRLELHHLTIMQFKVVSIAAALLASVSPAMSVTITGFDGAGCTGTPGQTNNVGAPVCFTYGSRSYKSIRYSGVPSNIEFYLSGGGHDSCTNGSNLKLGGGSGCATAPAG